MTRRDVNEGDVFRKGFATNALEKGATEGQVPAVGTDGEMEFVNAGGGSQPQLLGPYPFAYNTPNINTDGVYLGATIPASRLVQVLCIVTTSWTGAGLAAELDISLATGTPGVDLIGIPTTPTNGYRRLDAAQITGGAPGKQEAPVQLTGAGTALAPVAVATTAPCRLFATIFFTNTPTGGTAALYALVSPIA